MANRVWQSTSSTDVSSAGNYSGNTAPATGDTITLNNLGTAALATGFPSYTNILGATIHQLPTFLATIGVEASGNSGPTYLALGASGTSDLFVGRNEGKTGAGSTMSLWDFSTGTVRVHVFATGSKTGSYPTLCIKGSAVNINAYGGETGFAMRPGDTGTILSLVMAENPEATGTPVVRVGAGATVSCVPRVETGTLYLSGAGTISDMVIGGDGAEVRCAPTTTHTFTAMTLEEGGRFTGAGAVTITAATVKDGGVLDLTKDSQAKTVGTITAYKGASILLDNGVATSFSGTGGGNVTIYCPDGLGTVKVSAPAGLAIDIT